MTVRRFSKLSKDEKDLVINDIQSLYYVFNREHSATLSFAKVKKLTKYSTRLIKHCLYSDESFKEEMKILLKNKTINTNRGFKKTALLKMGVE